MAKLEWKSPFLRFRDQIRPLFDSGVEFYHGVVMTPFHRRSMVRETVQELKVAKAGKVRIAALETPTKQCSHHAHYFYGDKGAFVTLGHALSGIDDWIQSAPPGLLPKFTIPRKNADFKKDILTWTCLVYYLAWKLDLPYLRAACEFKPLLADGAFEPWARWPHQPAGVDLRPLLIHQGTSRGDLEPLQMKFSESERLCYFPDFIDAYLVGGKSAAEFIRASLTAVDVLVFMLDQLRDMEATKNNKRGSSTKSPKKVKNADGFIDNTTLLKAFLFHHHFPRESGKQPSGPLTAMQIAAAMKWSQSMVSRCMKKFLGPNGMAKYQRMFGGNHTPNQALRKLLNDGSREIDAIVKSSVNEDEFEENGLD